MSKYAPLTRHLGNLRRSQWRSTFREIENVLGFKLPSVARRYRSWWSNNEFNSVMTKAWLAAGWRTEQVDMAGETLVFKRTGLTSGRGASKRPGSHHPARRSASSPIGGLKGTVKIVGPEGSTGEKWNAEEGRL